MRACFAICPKGRGGYLVFLGLVTKQVSRACLQSKMADESADESKSKGDGLKVFQKFILNCIV